MLLGDDEDSKKMDTSWMDDAVEKKVEEHGMVVLKVDAKRSVLSTQ